MGDQPGVRMGAEIREQPDRWLSLVTHGVDRLLEAADLLRSVPESPVVFVARGSSDHAAIYGQYLVQLRLRRPAFLSAPSIASVAELNSIPSGALVIAISQSGESPDLLSTIERARYDGCQVIALTNNPSSAMAHLAHVPVDLCAGPELSVAATKTYTAELLAIAAIVRLAELRGANLADEIRPLVQSVEAGLASYQPRAVEIAESLAGADRLMVIGRMLSMATAKEAALKFMETCCVAASGWSAADAKHGPIGQISPGTPVLLTGTRGLGRDSVVALGEDVRALGATVIEPSMVSDLDLGDLEPIVGIVPFQMVARELALLKGLDPDRPAGLRKVTLTR